MAYEVRLANLNPVPLAVIRRRAKASDVSTIIPADCGTVWAFVRAHNLKAGRHVAIYWNGDIQLDVGVELADAFSEEGDVIRSATPGGPTASVVHFGPYGQLGAAHAAIRSWSTAGGHRLAGPNWEIYGHWLPEWNTDPSKIRTDVFYQIAPAS